jgi:hypothetical protein
MIAQMDDSRTMAAVFVVRTNASLIYCVLIRM